MKHMRLLLLSSIMLSHTALAYTPRAIYDASEYDASEVDLTKIEKEAERAKNLGFDAILMPKILGTVFIGTNKQPEHLGEKENYIAKLKKSIEKGIKPIVNIIYGNSSKKLQFEKIGEKLANTLADVDENVNEKIGGLLIKGPNEGQPNVDQNNILVNKGFVRLTNLYNASTVDTELKKIAGIAKETEKNIKECFDKDSIGDCLKTMPPLKKPIDMIKVPETKHPEWALAYTLSFPGGVPLISPKIADAVEKIHSGLIQKLIELRPEKDLKVKREGDLAARKSGDVDILPINANTAVAINTTGTDAPLAATDKDYKIVSL